jgi:hypothetical protein
MNSTRLFFFIFIFCLLWNVGKVQAQEHRNISTPKDRGAAAAVDSLHLLERSMDSLLKADSLAHVLRYEEERRFERTGQFATQRAIDLTNDGKPEMLRLEGYVDKKHMDDTKLTFTIKSGKKLLFEDSWTARGYFDTIDHLTDSIKLKRLRQIVTVFFANENFVVLDSSGFIDAIKRGTPADISIGSQESVQLFKEPRVMYSVFHSRDYWYGLVWDPARNRLVRAWRN